MGKQLIFEDFIQDRIVQMFKEHDHQTKQLDYSVFVQVFATDNLPFSPLTGDRNKIFFDCDQVNTDFVTIKGVKGDIYNSITQKYEVTDHTFVVGKVIDDKIDEKTAIKKMKAFTQKVIQELNKRIKMPNAVRPHILTDVERAKQLLTDRNVKITTLSRNTGIPAFTLYNYRKNPDALKKASYANIGRLVNMYYETYFNRNEIERFRFMLIKTVDAYLKECKNNPIMYNPVYELYMMCQHGDWHGLARMEEMWKASYIADNRF